MTVNILDKNKAEMLRKLGFHYVEQRLNDQQSVYVFVGTPELTQILNINFSKNDFFIGKTLNF